MNSHEFQAIRKDLYSNNRTHGLFYFFFYRLFHPFGEVNRGHWIATSFEGAFDIVNIVQARKSFELSFCFDCIEFEGILGWNETTPCHFHCRITVSLSLTAYKKNDRQITFNWDWWIDWLKKSSLPIEFNLEARSASDDGDGITIKPWTQIEFTICLTGFLNK